MECFLLRIGITFCIGNPALKVSGFEAGSGAQDVSSSNNIPKSSSVKYVTDADKDPALGAASVSSGATNVESHDKDIGTVDVTLPCTIFTFHKLPDDACFKRNWARNNTLLQRMANHLPRENQGVNEVPNHLLHIYVSRNLCVFKNISKYLDVRVSQESVASFLSGCRETVLDVIQKHCKVYIQDNMYQLRQNLTLNMGFIMLIPLQHRKNADFLINLMVRVQSLSDILSNFIRSTTNGTLETFSSNVVDYQYALCSDHAKYETCRSYGLILDVIKIYTKLKDTCTEKELSNQSTLFNMQNIFRQWSIFVNYFLKEVACLSYDKGSPTSEYEKILAQFYADKTLEKNKQYGKTVLKNTLGDKFSHNLLTCTGKYDFFTGITLEDLEKQFTYVNSLYTCVRDNEDKIFGLSGKVIKRSLSFEMLSDASNDLKNHAHELYFHLQSLLAASKHLPAKSQVCLDIRKLVKEYCECIDNFSFSMFPEVISLEKTQAISTFCLLVRFLNGYGFNFNNRSLAVEVAREELKNSMKTFVESGKIASYKSLACIFTTMRVNLADLSRFLAIYDSDFARFSGTWSDIPKTSIGQIEMILLKFVNDFRILLFVQLYKYGNLINGLLQLTAGSEIILSQ